jgi:hypothetical protein
VPPSKEGPAQVRRWKRRGAKVQHAWAEEVPERRREWGVVLQWSDRGPKEFAVDLIYFRVC